MDIPFVKVFSSITDSSIWCEDAETRVVWITMLAMSDSKGYVGASLPGLAARARVPIAKAEEAIALFLSPDKYSRSQEYDGRRIEVAHRGWRLLNYLAFREVRDAESRKAQNREAKRKSRASKKTTADGQQCQPKSAQEEEEAEKKKISDPPVSPPGDDGLGEPVAVRQTLASSSHIQEVRDGWAEAFDSAGGRTVPRLAPQLMASAVAFARDVAKKHKVTLREAAKEIAANVAACGTPGKEPFELAQLDPYVRRRNEPKPYVDPGW